MQDILPPPTPKGFLLRVSSITSNRGRDHSFRLRPDEVRQLVIKRQYDPHDHLKTLLSFSGTALEYVLKGWLFWTLTTINLAVFLGWKFMQEFHKERVLEYWSLNLDNLQPMGQLVVFAMVFYTGNCYNTYKDHFFFGCNMQRRMSQLAMHFKGIFQDGEVVWNCLRHGLSAHRVFYYELKKQVAERHGYNEDDPEHPGNLHSFVNEKLVRKSLLTPEEAEFLEMHEGQRTILLCTWAETSFYTHAASSPVFNKLSEPLKSQLLRVAIQEYENFRDMMNQTIDTVVFGVPFPYHHIVHLLVHIYLQLLSFATVFINDGRGTYMSLITYPVIVFVMLGIQSAADAMADPFGDDDCDFNLDAFVEEVYRDCVMLVTASDQRIIEGIQTGAIKIQVEGLSTPGFSRPPSMSEEGKRSREGQLRDGCSIRSAGATLSAQTRSLDGSMRNLVGPGGEREPPREDGGVAHGALGDRVVGSRGLNGGNEVHPSDEDESRADPASERAWETEGASAGMRARRLSLGGSSQEGADSFTLRAPSGTRGAGMRSRSGRPLAPGLACSRSQRESPSPELTEVGGVALAVPQAATSMAPVGVLRGACTRTNSSYASPDRSPPGSLVQSPSGRLDLSVPSLPVPPLGSPVAVTVPAPTETIIFQPDTRVAQAFDLPSLDALRQAGSAKEKLQGDSFGSEKSASAEFAWG